MHYIFFLIFYWFFVSSTFCTPIPLMSPFLCIYLTALQPSYPPKKGIKTISQWKLKYVTECHTVYPLSTHLYLQRFIAVSHWSGLRPLASATRYQYLFCPWDSSQIFCWALCGNPAAWGLQDWPFHALQQFIPEVDLGMGQLKALHLNLDGSSVGQPTSSPTVTQPGWGLQHCPG